MSPCSARCVSWGIGRNGCTGSSANTRRTTASTCSSAFTATPGLWWTKLAAAAWLRRSSSMIPNRPASACAASAARAMPSSLKARAARTSKKRSKGFEASAHALLALLREALPAENLYAVPRIPVRDLSYGVRQSDRAVPVYRARAVADRKAPPAELRPAHPRGRTALAHEKGRHAHHGRGADCGFGCLPYPALGQPAESVRLDRTVRAGCLRRHRLLGRLHQDQAHAQSGNDRTAEDPVPGNRGRDQLPVPADAAWPRRVLHRAERSLFQDIQARPADQQLAAQL